MKLYLCGPINGRSDDDCKGWREQVKAEWSGECLDPMRRDYRGREQEPGIAAEIVAGDLEDIEASDALLVFFDKPSVGTSMEVFLAHQKGKPVVVVDASGKPLSPWLTHHSTAIVQNIAEALRVLAGMNLDPAEVEVLRRLGLSKQAAERMAGADENITAGVPPMPHGVEGSTK